MSNFDERSGIVPVRTEWGRWWQTIEEVHIEVSSHLGHTFALKSAKDVSCVIKTKHLSLSIQGHKVFEGELFAPVHADDSVWTLEDKCLVRLCLSKAQASAAHCWPSLLVGQFQADSWTSDEMQKKLTLQRFQLENPGMDFSGAALTGNYQNGGPDLPG